MVHSSDNSYCTAMDPPMRYGVAIFRLKPKQYNQSPKRMSDSVLPRDFYQVYGGVPMKGRQITQRIHFSMKPCATIRSSCLALKASSYSLSRLSQVPPLFSQLGQTLARCPDRGGYTPELGHTHYYD